MPASMLWRSSSRPVRSRSKPPGFILPCQPALADRPPSGPGWLHEIKFDGYRVIARKDGEKCAYGPVPRRTTRRPSPAFATPSPRCRSIARCSTAKRSFCARQTRSDFEALRSRHGQAEAILVAYDIMEADGRTCAALQKGFY